MTVSVYRSLLALALFAGWCLSSGCSLIQNVPVLVQADSSDWKQTGSGYRYLSAEVSTPAYGLGKDSLDLTICPAPRGGRMLAFGPPFLPFIPNIFFPLADHSPRFFLDLKATNTASGSRVVELSGSRYYRSGHPLPVDCICRLDLDCFGYPTNFNSCGRECPNAIEPSQLIVAPNDTVAIRIWFSEKLHKVRHLQCSMADLPPLTFKTKRRIFYLPAAVN